MPDTREGSRWISYAWTLTALKCEPRGGAVAHIRFKLNEQREWSGKVHVIVRDGCGKVVRVEDVYEAVPILLGDNGEFFVKLARDDRVEFEDGNELWVNLESWTK